MYITIVDEYGDAQTYGHDESLGMVTGGQCTVQDMFCICSACGKIVIETDKDGDCRYCRYDKNNG